jgi:two-component system nitrogen regulation response regulator GlnG
LLARYFLQQSAQSLGVEPKQLAPAALRYLSSLNWGGNVRQLENVCHWLTVMAPGQNVDVADLPPELRQDGETHAVAMTDWLNGLENQVAGMLDRGEPNVLETLTRQFERAIISKALTHTGGRRIEAAILLGMGRNTLTRKVQELGIEG